MEKELLLLRKLYTNPELTQRDMAKATGISLGSVNTFIKQLVKKGTLSIETMTQRKIVYSLTELGLRKKAELAYRYIIEAYLYLKELSVKLDDILKTTCEEDCILVLFGYRDELYEFIEAKLNEKGVLFKFVYTFDEIKLLSQHNNILIIVWQPEIINIIKDIEFRYVDLLDSI